MNCLDNYDQWLAHEAKQEKLLELLPFCDYCGEVIQDDFCWKINDEIICEKCLNEHFRKRTEDFVV
jgi:formylmethanofuran dehydrogenase subunit E